MALSGAIFLALFVTVFASFDGLDEDGLIPSDGFHDLLGLTPFWMVDKSSVGLRRTLGMKRDDLPANWDAITSQTSGSKVYTIAGSCSLDATFSAGKAVLKTKVEGDCTKPSFKVIFEKLFPAIQVSMTTEKFITLDKFDFEELTIATASKKVEVKGTARDSWRIAEKNLVLANAKLTLGFTAGKEITGIKDWEIHVEGSISVSSKTISMKINKVEGQVSMPFTWEVESITITELMGIFEVTMDSFKFEEVGFDSAQLEGITFNGAAMKGALNPDESYQLVCKSKATFSKLSGDVYLILTRPAEQVTKASVIIEIKEISDVGQALGAFATQFAFISGFGMIGVIERDCIIMLAKDDITMIDDDEIDKLVSPFITEHDTKHIPKGVNVRVKVPIKDNLKKCSASANTGASVPNVLPITIAVTADGLGFQFPDNFLSDMLSMLKCLDTKIGSVLPTQLFPKPNLPIHIKEIFIASPTNVKITIALKGPFKFLGGKIKIDDLELSVEWKKGEDLKFSGSTTVTVGSIAVGLALEKQGKSYQLAVSVDSFKLNQLEELIGPTTFTDFMSMLGSLDGFGIKEFKLVKNFGADSDSALRVSGKPILWGWEKVSIEGLVWNQEKEKDKVTKAVAVGIVLEDVRLDKLIEKMLGDNVFKTAWFSEMTAVIVVSNAEAKVESSTDNDGNSTSNDIGNKDKELGDDSSKEKKPDQRTIYNHLARNKYAIARYIRDVKPVRKLTPIRNFQRVKRPIGNRGVPLKYARQPMVKGGRRLPSNARQVPIRHAPGARRDDEEKKDENSEGEKGEEEGGEKEEEAEEEEEEEEEEEGEEMKFTIPYLSSQDISPGLTFVGIFKIPKDNGCKEDALCLWLSKTVGSDAKIEITGKIGKSSFEFGAKFTGTIPLVAGKLNMQSIELKLTLEGKDSNVRLECTLLWTDKEILGSTQIQFLGAVEVGLTGKLSLEFNMIGMWRNPFGFQYLAFGNLHLAIGMSVGAPIPSFEFGAEIWIGKIKEGANDHAIKIKGYFGIDPNKPSDNYVYASISAFTLDSVYKAFELGKPNVPKCVRESGFPEGVTVAYSLEGKTIDALGIEIGAGLYLKGTINIFGFSVSAEIVINPPSKFLVDVQLSPIDWAGGLIALRRNEKDKKNGPKAYIYITEESINVQIEGYISMLGMSRYVYIDVSDDSFKFKTTTDLWGSIKSNLTVEAAYGSLAEVDFKFHASVSIDFHFDDLFKAVKEYLQKAADIAEKKIEEAKQKVLDSKSALTNAKSKMQGWRNKLDEYKNWLQQKSDEIEESKKKLQNDCKAECGKVCIPFLDWKPECFKIFWWWVGCPTWNSCRWKVDNVICIAGCEIKKLANKFVAWAQQVGIKILMGFADVAKGLISVGEGFVTMAEKVVDFAANFLTFVQGIVAAGAEVAAQILDWAAENLFKLKLLELNGKFDSDFNACVGLKIYCMILGLDINWEGELCINLNFFKYLAMIVSNYKYSGLKTMYNRLDEIESKKEDLEKNENDVKVEEQKIDKDVSKETSDRGKRDYVPSEKEMYYMNLANERLPSVVTRGPETIAAFKNDAPWVLIQDFDMNNFDHMPKPDVNIPAEKRTLDEDWKKHAASPCVQIRKVIDKYDMITDGLAALHGSMTDVREGYQATKRTMQQGVDSLKNDIDLTEMKHNMTHEEREDLYHWYNEAKDGLDKWDKKATDVLHRQRSMALPTYRSQINHILMKEKNTDFAGYMHELHSVGQAASKRSTIPNGSANEAAEELHKIKKDILNLVASEEANPLLFGRQVRSIRSNIKGLRRTMEKCK